MLGPGQGRFDGDRRRTDGVQVGDKTRQKTLGVGQVVAKALAEAKVVVGDLAERAHRPAPGHGWATLRSDVKSTFYGAVVARSR